MADAGATNPARGYERDAVNIKAVLITASAIIATVLAVAVINAWLSRGFADWYGRTAPSPSTLRPPAVAGPALQPSPDHDIAKYREEKRRLLGEYRWLDKKAGIVRMPINEAMRRLADGGVKQDGR